MSECSIYGGSKSSMSIPVLISTEVKLGYASRSSSQQPFPSSSNGNIVGHGILSTGGHPPGSSKNNRVRLDVDEVEDHSPPNHSDNASAHCHKIQNSFKEIEKSAESAVSHASPPWQRFDLLHREGRSESVAYRVEGEQYSDKTRRSDCRTWLVQ